MDSPNAPFFFHQHHHQQYQDHHHHHASQEEASRLCGGGYPDPHLFFSDYMNQPCLALAMVVRRVDWSLRCIEHSCMDTTHIRLRLRLRQRPTAVTSYCSAGQALCTHASPPVPAASAPSRPMTTAASPPSTKRRAAQKIHRLAILAWHDGEELERLVFGVGEASHRCNEPSCFRPDHLVVDGHGENERGSFVWRGVV